MCQRACLQSGAPSAVRGGTSRQGSSLVRGVKALRFWGRLIVICKGHPATAYLRAKRSQSSLQTGLEDVPVKVASHQLGTVNTIDGGSTASSGRSAAQKPQRPCLWADHPRWHPRSTCPPFAANHCIQQLGPLPRLTLAIPSALWYSMSSSFSP